MRSLLTKILIIFSGVLLSSLVFLGEYHQSKRKIDTDHQNSKNQSTTSEDVNPNA